MSKYKDSLDYIIDYIENEEKYSREEATLKINNFIKDTFLDKEIESFPNLLYVYLMINIRRVDCNDFTKKIYSKIKKNLKNNCPILGIQLLTWYIESVKIFTIINKSIKELGFCFDDCLKESIKYLFSKAKLTDNKRELADLLLKFTNSKEMFNFTAFKTFENYLRGINENTEIKQYVKEHYTGLVDSGTWINDEIKKYPELNMNNFEYLDEIISVYLKYYLYDMLTQIDLCTEMNKRLNVNTDVGINFIDKIKEMSKILKYNFFETKTYKAIIYFYIYNYYYCISNPTIYNDKDNYFYDYLKYKKNKVIFDRTAFSIINAYNLKRVKVKNYNKIKENILTTDISKFFTKIKNFQKLNVKEKKEFIKLLNNIKIVKKLIPYNICKYVIYCILKYNDFLEIKECILCDFITNVQKRNNIKDILNVIANEELMIHSFGVLRYKKKRIFINEKIVSDFSKDNVKVLDTIFHEIEHVIQRRDIENENFYGNRYKMFIEKNLSNKIKNYSYYNYYNEYREIEAMEVAAMKLKEFLEDLNLDINTIYVKDFYNKKTIVNEYVSNSLNKCKEYYKFADIKYIDNNTKENIIDLWNKYKYESSEIEGEE